MQCILMDSLEASDHVNHPSPGDAQWHRTLVRACLEFQLSWPKGEYVNRAGMCMDMYMYG